jgi:uncharacterized protein (TIGR02271 family)
MQTDRAAESALARSNARDEPARGAAMARVTQSETVVPVAAEDVVVGKAAKDVERVRVKTSVTVEDAVIDARACRERLEVERVPVGRVIDRAPPPVRVEGDTTIFSVVEEVVTVERRLVLEEEVRVRKRRVEEPRTLRIPLRAEHVEIERAPLSGSAGGGRVDRGDPAPRTTGTTGTNTTRGGTNMRTIIGLFDDKDEARRTIEDLERAGASANDISVISKDEIADFGGIHQSPLDIRGLGKMSAHGPLTAYLNRDTAAESGDAITSVLMQMGVPEPTATAYVDAVRKGCTLETVAVDDAKADEALRIMRAHAANLEPSLEPGLESERSEGDLTERRVGESGYVAGTERPLESRDLRGSEDLDERLEAKDTGDASVLPVAEEELRVGKREVGSGGVRATSRVHDVPVEQEVSLKKESVNVERRDVDRPLTDADDAFRERTVEVTARSEEPVIEKRAHVIEEVVLRKDADTTTETIRDTVRKTDVNVEEIGAFDPKLYRDDYSQRYAKMGSSEDFESYRPAYKFGHEMRGDKRFSGDDWSNVEPNARSAWEERNPGTWERFKGAVRHAWDRAKH